MWLNLTIYQGKNKTLPFRKEILLRTPKSGSTITKDRVRLDNVEVVYELIDLQRHSVMKKPNAKYTSQEVGYSGKLAIDVIGKPLVPKQSSGDFIQVTSKQDAIKVLKEAGKAVEKGLTHSGKYEIAIHDKHVYKRYIPKTGGSFKTNHSYSDISEIWLVSSSGWYYVRAFFRNQNPRSVAGSLELGYSSDRRKAAKIIPALIFMSRKNNNSKKIHLKPDGCYELIYDRSPRAHNGRFFVKQDARRAKKKEFCIYCNEYSPLGTKVCPKCKRSLVW